MPAILLFSLDSLIKINLEDFRIHISHLLLIIAMALSAISTKKWLGQYARQNRTIIFLLVYLLLHVFIAADLKTYIVVLSYFLLAIMTHAAIFTYANKINFNLFFKRTLILLVATGFAQYLLYVVFNYQISLGGLSDTYYNDGGSIANRMRGFFLEPNWYGLYLASAFIGYIMTLDEKRPHILLMSLSFACLFLSENRLTLYFVLLSTSIFFYEKHVHKIQKYFLIMVCLAPIIFLLTLTFSDTLSGAAGDDRSVSARSVTVLKTATYIENNFSPPSLLFGNGLSTWGEIAYQENLSSRASSEKSKTARDTSESYVVVFELGLVGALLFFLDFYTTCNTATKRTEKTQIIILSSLVFCAAFYYPTFYFMMYLAPYFAARTYCSPRSKLRHV